MKPVFKSIIFIFTVWLFSSCQKEQEFNIQDQHNEVNSEEIILGMPTMNYDSLYVQTLNGIIARYESINDELNDELDIHIASIDGLTETEITSYFDSVSVADVAQLISLIELAEDYESQILSNNNKEYVEALISNVPGTNHVISGRPFWGVGDCEPIGDPYFGVGDAPCYQDYRCKKYRFWIHWGGYEVGYDEVPCP